MIVDQGVPTVLGSPPEEAPISFREAPGDDAGWMQRRELAIRGEAAFELTFWCGTCPFLFDRLGTGDERRTFDQLGERLRRGSTRIDREVVDIAATLLPRGEYLPLLLEVTPILVGRDSPHDYFVREHVETWGEPHDPRTEYYRTWDSRIAEDVQLFEFLVPLVPTSWNDPSHMDVLRDEMRDGTVPTAVAVSTLDVSASEHERGPGRHSHWGLTHFLLDGHHKVAAAAAEGRPVRIMSLLALDASLSDPDQVAAALRARRTG